MKLQGSIDISSSTNPLGKARAFSGKQQFPEPAFAAASGVNSARYELKKESRVRR
jgi:hypothetical protein